MFRTCFIHMTCGRTLQVRVAIRDHGGAAGEHGIRAHLRLPREPEGLGPQALRSFERVHPVSFVRRLSGSLHRKYTGSRSTNDFNVHA